MQPALADPEHPRAYGANYVYCNGCGITGPDRRTALVSLAMILIPSVVFMIWTSPWFASHFGVGVPLTQALLVLLTVYFFSVTACSDPGILPRHRSPMNAFDPLTGAYRARQPPRYQDVVINGNCIRLKFCTTCNIYRPPRSVHCAICDNCVERFDHHCPWLGNCIGLRNYRTFIFFVIFCSLLSVFTFVSSAVKVAFVVVWLRADGLNSDDVFQQLWGKATESVLLLVYTFVLSWFVLALFAYHGYLIATNQTTYEQIKSFFYEGNPWSKGLAGNLADVFCRPVRARYFSPLMPVLCFLEEDDLGRSSSPLNELSGDSARDTPSPLAREESAHASGSADLDVPLSQRPFANKRSPKGEEGGQPEKPVSSVMGASSSGVVSDSAAVRDPRGGEIASDGSEETAAQALTTSFPAPSCPTSLTEAEAPPAVSMPSGAGIADSGALAQEAGSDQKLLQRLSRKRQSEAEKEAAAQLRQKADARKSGDRRRQIGGGGREKGGRGERDLGLSSGKKEDDDPVDGLERRETRTPVEGESRNRAGATETLRTRPPTGHLRKNAGFPENKVESPRTPQQRPTASDSRGIERRAPQEAKSTSEPASGSTPGLGMEHASAPRDREMPAFAGQRLMVTTAVMGRPADFEGKRANAEGTQSVACEETPTMQALSSRASSSALPESHAFQTTPGENPGRTPEGPSGDTTLHCTAATETDDDGERERDGREEKERDGKIHKNRPSTALPAARVACSSERALPPVERDAGSVRGKRCEAPQEEGQGERRIYPVSSRPGRRVVPSPRRTDENHHDGDYLVHFKSETSSRFASYCPRVEGNSAFLSPLPEAPDCAEGVAACPCAETVFFSSGEPRGEDEVNQVFCLNQEEETLCSCFPSAAAPPQRGSTAGESSKGRIRFFSSGSFSAFRLFSSCFVAVPTPWARNRGSGSSWSGAYRTRLPAHSQTAEISPASASHSTQSLSHFRSSSSRVLQAFSHGGRLPASAVGAALERHRSSARRDPEEAEGKQGTCLPIKKTGPFAGGCAPGQFVCRLSGEDGAAGGAEASQNESSRGTRNTARRETAKGDEQAAWEEENEGRTGGDRSVLTYAAPQCCVSGPLSPRRRQGHKDLPSQSLNVSLEDHKAAGNCPSAPGRDTLPCGPARGIEAESMLNTGLGEAVDGDCDDAERDDLNACASRSRSVAGKACRCLPAGEWRGAASRESRRPHVSCAFFSDTHDAANCDLETGRLHGEPGGSADATGVAHTERASSCLGGKRMRDLVLRCGAIACVLPDDEDEDIRGGTAQQVQENMTDSYSHILREAPSFRSSARVVISQRWSDGAVALGEKREYAMYERAKHQGYNSGELFSSGLLGSAAFDQE
ncbi:DHHC zinc finger domain-containing protein [Toxoplasma gondii VEG]|uniref:protein S-acyltransferase n=7 Tax=Toxoplasma gondii TaxID=5811 RepID=V4ZEH6_TOXGV|nr:DHHC zinc finger domain-containing protein [Toxoplasma gondii VEG]KFG44384.1 DHHC zinc finger domain-containing protein [Toxoplasma gondii p89]CEL72821.1 TPA: zinc finger DHHC domain-containing protein [Toxoplasma gondii VEG]